MPFDGTGYGNNYKSGGVGRVLRRTLNSRNASTADKIMTGMRKKKKKAQNSYL